MVRIDTRQDYINLECVTYRLVHEEIRKEKQTQCVGNSIFLDTVDLRKKESTTSNGREYEVNMIKMKNTIYIKSDISQITCFYCNKNGYLT